MTERVYRIVMDMIEKGDAAQILDILRFESDNIVPESHDAINLYHPKTDQKP